MHDVSTQILHGKTIGVIRLCFIRDAVLFQFSCILCLKIMRYVRNKETTLLNPVGCLELNIGLYKAICLTDDVGSFGSNKLVASAQC
jgi:hypothetical protein